MLDLLYSLEGGVGLAAPQVGVAVRLLVYDAEGGFSRERGAIANCELEPDRAAGRTRRPREGCLSAPGLFVGVDRWSAVEFSGVRPGGEPVSGWAEGLQARVLQHECDYHLRGRCIVGAARR
jgi:peptide deformylase